MNKRIIINFSLMDVKFGLSTLQQHLDLLEQQIESSRSQAKTKLEANVSELSIDDDDDLAQYDLLHQEYELQVDFVLPRLLRCPFLISLYSTYESAVTQIAEIMQERQGQRISLGNLNGDFLSRANLYYGHILQLELSVDNTRWRRVRLLADLRNSFAHANGLIKASRKKKIQNALKHEGVDELHGYVVVTKDFVQETLVLVKSELDDLLARYQELAQPENRTRES